MGDETVKFSTEINEVCELQKSLRSIEIWGEKVVMPKRDVVWSAESQKKLRLRRIIND
jgi:hypothetical protein